MTKSHLTKCKSVRKNRRKNIHKGCKLHKSLKNRRISLGI